MHGVSCLCCLVGVVAMHCVVVVVVVVVDDSCSVVVIWGRGWG